LQAGFGQKQMQMVADRRHVSFMWRCPNYLPLPTSCGRPWPSPADATCRCSIAARRVAFSCVTRAPALAFAVEGADVMGIEALRKAAARAEQEFLASDEAARTARRRSPAYVDVFLREDEPQPTRDGNSP
jgi:hypothetical protein